MSAVDSHVKEVLAAYPLLKQAVALPLGGSGGFSGARLWRLQTPAGDFCLRAWPATGPAAEQLAHIHRLMRLARAAGIPFVPTVLASAAGQSWRECAGRLWDVSAWMPGRADFHAHPSRARLESACAALAILHAAWVPPLRVEGASPAVRRRLDADNDWLPLLETGWQPPPSPQRADPVEPWLARAVQIVRERLPDVPRRLVSWAERPFPLQPCLCDVWHDQVLYTGEVVSGLIDFGGVKLDHVAVDLARLLGSLIGDDADLRSAGLQAYVRIRPLSLEEETLVVLLDETGVVVGLANWLKWLCLEKRAFEDRRAVARRLAELVTRAERWSK